jgi:hypothetical protein
MQQNLSTVVDGSDLQPDNCPTFCRFRSHKSAQLFHRQSLFSRGKLILPQFHSKQQIGVSQSHRKRSSGLKLIQSRRLNRRVSESFQVKPLCMGFSISAFYGILPMPPKFGNSCVSFGSPPSLGVNAPLYVNRLALSFSSEFLLFCVCHQDGTALICGP